MKQVKVKTYVTTNNFIDEDGVVKESETSVKHEKIIVSDKESFFWVYASLSGVLNELDKSCQKLIFYCGKHATYNENIIHLQKAMIDMNVTKETGMSYKTIRNTIDKLVKLKILIPLAQRSAAFRINPKYYWKGDSNTRLQKMKYIIEVECPDCL